MNRVSLRKLSLFSFSLLTLCCAGLINDVQAAVPSMEDAVLRAQRPSTRPLSLRDTQALTLSNNTINTYTLLFSEAIRAGEQPNPDPVLQRQLVCELRQLLTKKFSITLISPTQTLTATDFNSLLALLQQESASTTFVCALIGNLSLESISRDARERRTLQIQGLRYSIGTSISGQSHIEPALDQFTVVETSPGIYKIQTVVRNRLTEIPFGTPAT